MWQLLRHRQRRNIKFRRQHPLGIYTADFYSVVAKLVIEIDGESHFSEDGQKHDAKRDRWMRDHGIRVLRFTCSQVENETQKVLAAIDETLLENPSPLSP